MNNMETFKTLVWKNDRDKILGKYAIIFQGALCGCDIPELLTMDATIGKMKLIYRVVNFSLVELITVKLYDMSTITETD